MAPFELADEGPPQYSAPEPTEPSAPVNKQPSPPAAQQPKVTPSHTLCTAMTLEAITALQAAGINLDTTAVSTIYNTHFMALTDKQKKVAL